MLSHSLFQTTNRILTPLFFILANSIRTYLPQLLLISNSFALFTLPNKSFRTQV